MNIAAQLREAARKVLDEEAFGVYSAVDGARPEHHAALDLICSRADSTPADWSADVRCLVLCLAASIVEQLQRENCSEKP
jgi:hypothetical protein